MRGSAGAHDQPFDLVLLRHRDELVDDPAHEVLAHRRGQRVVERRASPSCRAARRGRRRAHRRPAPAPGRAIGDGCAVPRWMVSATARRDVAQPGDTCGRRARRNRGQSSSGGNISCFHARPSSYCVPGAISNGPMSSVTSTPVRLNASDVSRRSLYVSAGEGKSRCHGWYFAPWNGTSKPISTISYSRAEHRLAHRGHPRMRHEVDEAGDLLRVDLHVPAPRPATDGAAGPLNRLPERGHHVLAQALGPRARERARQRGHTGVVERADVVIHSQRHGPRIASAIAQASATVSLAVRRAARRDGFMAGWPSSSVEPRLTTALGLRRATAQVQRVRQRSRMAVAVAGRRARLLLRRAPGGLTASGGVRARRRPAPARASRSPST